MRGDSGSYSGLLIQNEFITNFSASGTLTAQSVARWVYQHRCFIELFNAIGRLDLTCGDVDRSEISHQRRRRPFYPHADFKKSSTNCCSVHVPTKVPKLERAPRVARKVFAREHRKWTTEWIHVLFTNESRFCFNFFVDAGEMM